MADLPKGQLISDHVLLQGTDAITVYDRGYYGLPMNEGVELTGFDFMARYLVYKDLRNRGYVVNQGSGSSFFFRLYLRGHVPKKDPASYYVTPLQEGSSINLSELDDLVKLAKKSSKELVFGLVDASGDVSYLQVNQLYPSTLDQRPYSDFTSWDWDQVWAQYSSW